MMDTTNRAALPAGTVIAFCGDHAVVVRDYGGSKLTVEQEGTVMDWYWCFEGECCEVISMPELSVIAPNATNAAKENQHG